MGNSTSCDNYVAYVGTYTHGSSIGIHVYEVDTAAGRMKERTVVPVHNASYMTISANGKYLYSIADEGVEVLRIEDNGDLTPLNKVGIEGMRGCYLSVDPDGRYLYVGGYHDGKVTVLETREDGTLGGVRCGIFHQGIGSIAERNYRPHVSCVIPTPNGRYVCAVDNGLDQVKIYRLSGTTGKLSLYDILHCGLDTAPRWMAFSPDGRFAYMNFELSNKVIVYAFDESGKGPHFEKIQEISSIMDAEDVSSASCSLRLSGDGRYLYCSSAGENTCGVFRVDQESGMLERICILPISGGYPKDIGILPDGRTMVVLCHDSNYLRFFTIDYEKGTLIMNGPQLPVETPNCIVITKTRSPQS